MEPELWKVQKSNIDDGLFANKNIAKGDVILKVWGKVLCFNDTTRLKDKESYCLQIGVNKYIALHFPFFLCNHSCNPNCGINNNLEFVALRNITENEELTWDYSTSMMERYWTMKCKCGEANCRKVIQDFDLLPGAIQRKYLDLHIVLPYILNLAPAKANTNYDSFRA